MNPIALLQALPAWLRALVYLVVWLGGIVYSAITAANGDWHVAIPAIVGTVVAMIAHANVSPAAVQGD